MDDIKSAYQALQQGDVATAERIAGALLQRNPRDVSAIMVLAMIEGARGNLHAAAQGFEQAIALQPSRADAHFNLGTIRAQQGRTGDALARFEQTIRLDPANQRARVARADLLFMLSRWADAILAFGEVIAVDPNEPDYWLKRGVALRGLNNYDAALRDFQRALELAPEDAVCHGAVGATLTAMGRFPEAIEHLSNAIARDPGFPDALLNRAMAHRALQDNERATADFERAFALASSDDPRVLIGYVAHLHRLGRHEDIEGLLRRARVANPVLAGMVRGNWLADQMKNDEALETYDETLALKPDDAMTLHARGLLRLRLGEFRQGFRDFEQRLEGEIGTAGRALPGEVWQPGSGKPDHTLLIYCEQALGEFIQFARFVPEVIERGHEVTLVVPQELVELSRSLHPGLTLVAAGALLPHFEARCSLISLPAKLGIVAETLPAQVPYLRASAPAAARWHGRVAELPAPRVGICWSSTVQHGNDLLRSIPLEQFVELLPDAGKASVVRLQKDLRSGDAAQLSRAGIVDFTDELQSFDDTAAVIEALDLIVTVDTSIADLAGALGKPAWVLLPFAPDWRWQTNREDSPWYPTARLYRQARFADWSDVLARVRADLAAWVSARKA